MLENYSYLKEHNIENYVKYFTFDGNVSGRNPDPYFLNGDKTVICLNGNTGILILINNRHPKKAGSVFYKAEGCTHCPFSDYCKRYMKDKDEDFKIFEVSEELSLYKQQAFANLLSVKGIEMRVNRSSQVEGAFGAIKQDMNYQHLRRISMEKVETEIMLTRLGHNIRKLFRYYEGKARFNYWTAPENIKSEEKRKPSAKRLSNRANKKKTKSVNQSVKDNYKYK